MSPRHTLPVIATPEAQRARPADDGWVRRCTATPPRLHELVELYEALGFAVRLEPAGQYDTDCGSCSMAAERGRTIYTKEAT
jgi:hypothetical protein